MIREFFRLITGAAIRLAILVTVIAALLFAVVKGGFMASAFSPKVCEEEGGTWDHAIEVCRE